MFLALIFGVRILIEFVKEPQVGFERNMILNLGQSLSIPFVLIGIALVLWSLGVFRRRGEKKPGS
jgi:prolipoprotein diacylglyceryltransferase